MSSSCKNLKDAMKDIIDQYKAIITSSDISIELWLKINNVMAQLESRSLQEFIVSTDSMKTLLKCDKGEALTFPEIRKRFLAIEGVEVDPFDLDGFYQISDEVAAALNLSKDQQISTNYFNLFSSIRLHLRRI